MEMSVCVLFLTKKYGGKWKVVECKRLFCVGFENGGALMMSMGKEASAGCI